MKNPIGFLKKQFSGLAHKVIVGTALTISLIQPMRAETINGITIAEDYSTYNWNNNTTLWDSNSNETTKITSKIILNGNNLQIPLNNLRFYTAGTINPDIKLYKHPTLREYIPISNVRINNEDSSWQIESITNLGKSPNIFGLTNNLVFIDENATDSPARFDNNTRVFNRDIYEVILSTPIPTNNFTLDLELITDEPNTTNNNETCAFGVLHTRIINNEKTTYYGYLNRIFGKMNTPLDASKEDWNNNDIANSFEATYSGGPTNMLAEADEDNDGANNLQEYNAGTNPSDSNSVFKVTGLEAITNTAKITWQGSLTNFFYNPINYSVESSTNLQDNNSWNTLASNLNAQTYSDTNLNEKMFYRIKTKSE